MSQVTDYLGDGSKLGVRITYAVEPDGLHIGTAGSLNLIEHLLKDTFLVAQADTLTEIPLREAVNFHRTSGAHATIVLTRVKDPSNFGVAVLDGDGSITEFQEKPSKEEARGNLVSTGFYLMEPDSLDYVTEERWDFAKDLFPRLLKLHKKLSGFTSDAFWIDVGNLSGYLGGVRWVLDGMARESTLNAVDARPPNGVVIDSDVRVGRDVRIVGPALIESGTVIEDGATLQRHCVLKRNAFVSSGTVLDRSVVMERASIGRNCKIIDSVIGQSAVLQENVTIRGSIIGPGCVVGDRVEATNGSRVWPNVQIGADERVTGIVAAPQEKAFYFYTEFGQYTGLQATTIEGFIEALQKVPIESIEFHAKRRDFERWARDVLGSNELADGIEDHRRAAVTGEPLRSDLVGVTKKWADEVSSPRMDTRPVKEWR